MMQPISDHEHHFYHDLSPDERKIVDNIRERIRQNINHVSPAIAYELSQILGLVSQIARTKDIDNGNGVIHSAVNSLFGRPDIIVPREELLAMLEAASIILTENIEEPKNTQRQRLIFAREIIHKIDIQSRKFPNPLASLYARYTTLEDRLLSGVVWFFTLFFVFPSASILAIMVYYARTTPEINKEDFRASVENIITVQDNMRTSLEDIQSEVNGIVARGQSAESLSQEPDATGSISVPISTINQIGASANNGLQNIANIENAKESLESLIEDESTDRSDTSNTQPFLDTIGLEINRSLVWAEIFVLLVSVAMGALGGSVSVIMTSDKLVNVTKRKKVDPFYIGFFRPFIGMAFAIFVVSLIESGVFSNILSSEESRRPRERLYLFAAIAFVAGFSERFAPGLADQVSKTPLRESDTDTQREDDPA